jgi:hypothetical protein
MLSSLKTIFKIIIIELKKITKKYIEKDGNYEKENL